MKLIIILAVTSCAFAAKLDRTYLPPAGAEVAGGSPGALNAPRGPHSSVSSSGSPFGGANQPLGQISHSSNAPSFGSQNGIQGSNGRGNQGQVTASGIQEIQSGNRAPSNFFNDPNDSFGNAPASFDQNTKPSNQELAVNPNFRQSYTQPERAQAAQDRTAEIIRYDNEIDGDSFAYSFETSNGISAEASGVATNGVQAKGAFSYTGDDGQIYSISYTADENGYQPHGDHLPTPPPIPEEILRSIEENARAAAAGTQEGAYNEDENISQYDGQRPDASQQQYQPQQSSRPSNQYGASNTQNLAAPQINTQYDATNNALNNHQDLQKFGADQSFNRPQFNQGSQINSARPSNQYGAPGSIQSTILQGNTQFDNTNSPSSDHQNFHRPSASQFTSPQFNQGSRVINQQPSRPTNQYAIPSAQNSATPQIHSGIPSNNHHVLQKPSGQSFNKPQFNQGSQVYNQQSSRPSNQNGAAAQLPTTSSTDRYNSQNNQAATKDFPSSTQFNAQSGYQYDRPLAKGIDAQPSQSSNFNMQFPSPSGQSSTNLHRPFNAPGRHSGTNQPSGFKVPSQNYSESAIQYNAPSKPGQDFSGPRQHPSFSPEEGYKY